jgi:hypothetical protein
MQKEQRCLIVLAGRFIVFTIMDIFSQEYKPLPEKLLFMQDLEISAVTAVSLCGAYLPSMQQKITD